MTPRPHARGSIRDTFAANPHLETVLPAMGYSDEQRGELKDTIEACFEDGGAEYVIDACPGQLHRIMDLSVPIARVRYRFAQLDGPPLLEWIERRLAALA